LRNVEQHYSNLKLTTMPNQIIDFGKFVVWRANGNNYSTDVFICSHGGYDNSNGNLTLPNYNTGKPNMFFYGAHGTSITEGTCNTIIASANPPGAAKSIAGPGSPCWNYILAEYKRDWFNGATASAVQAQKSYGVLHDILMIKGSSGIITLKDVLSTLASNNVKYLNYHYMACR
jgi:hypothetical protein